MNALLRPSPVVCHRPMVPTDVDAVLALEQQAYAHPWSQGNFIDSLAAGYATELRLDGQGRLLGYFVALPGFEETHLLNLTVAPGHQRAGHGRALLARVQAYAGARGDQALWLEVRPSNQAARALYQQSGFVEVGCRHNYYPDGPQKRENALVLRLSLTPAVLAASTNTAGNTAGNGQHDALV